MPKMGWLSRLKRRPPTREPSGPEVQRVHRMIHKQNSASPPFLLPCLLLRHSYRLPISCVCLRECGTKANMMTIKLGRHSISGHTALRL